jgi:hypothetical protein
MSSPLSAILLSLSVSLTDWAEAMEPVPGKVQVAADEDEGLDILGQGPKGWRLVLWAAGEDPKGAADDFTAVKIRVGLAAERGLAKSARDELTIGRQGLPPILDMIEGTVATCRGLHTSAQPPPLRADNCFLLRFKGWQWEKFLTGANHYAAKLTFELDRQLSARAPRQVRL